ncbi:MAG: SUMF1/EgtB/PvdO family nonheme iron enzyme [Kiritimatiellia bacterium]|jgi:hypothetical protein|nr:SUMF1/EgtB/PvdO family nonheme iron enzyme [Kiritimatiellia bacterium]
MKTKLIGMACMAWAVFWACVTAAAEPSISQVKVRQRWPWSPLVDIDYVLSADEGVQVDIAVQAFEGEATLALPLGSWSGDLHAVSKGARHIVWDPTVTACTNAGVLTDFRVSLTPTPVPLYMIVDLTRSPGAEGQIEYVYPGDARLETHGYWTNVWFGVTNDAVYTSDKLVMRRVRAGSYKAGFEVPPTIDVTVSKDFYVGVFALTVAQYRKIMGGTPSASATPNGYMPYYGVRGYPSDSPPVNWPSTGSHVNPTSFIGVVRFKTGISDLDLPTCAQREYFCRAGTTSYYHDGESTGPSTNILDRLAWWVHNAGVTLWPVGLLEANHWGLYDTIGNAFEWCLNWDSGATPLGGVDPTGPETGTKRMLMGYNRSGSVTSCRPSATLLLDPSNPGGASTTVRLIWPLP